MKNVPVFWRSWILPQIFLGLILLSLTARQFRAVDPSTFNQIATSRGVITPIPRQVQNDYRIYVPVQVKPFSESSQTNERTQIFNPTLRGVGPGLEGLISHTEQNSRLNNNGLETAEQQVAEEHLDALQDDKEVLQLSFPNHNPNNLNTERPALYPLPWVPTPYDHFYFSRPIAADNSAWAYPDYRYGGVFFPGIVHSGVDLQAKMRTPILAAASGRVTWAGYGASTGTYNKDDPYGLAVIIRHDFGW
ncbi:MAG: M23 family metallopeptidase, partial [Anaerolineales bacterium]